MITNTPPKIILASTSVFRKRLLNKLNLPFETDNPNIDETPLIDETVSDMVNRLTLKKAMAVAAHHPNSLIIASDQSAVFDNKPLGKPHTFENGFAQLKLFSGQSVQFITGLVLLDTRQTPYRIKQTQETTTVQFRSLSDTQISHYLKTEKPYHCAGSFKSEGLGITLFEKIITEDPNALIGLPLIKLTTFFNELGILLPLEPTEKTHA